MTAYFLPGHNAHGIIQFGAAAMFCLALTGCAGVSSLFEEKRDTPMSDEEVAAFVQEWQQTKPQLDELASLKSDLAIILEEVNRQTDINNLPDTYADRKQTDYVEADEPEFPLDESFEDGTSMPEDGGDETEQRQAYAAHLAYFLREDSAWQGWKRIAQRFPLLEKTVTPRVLRVERESQTLYSLRVGPFESEQASDRVCTMFSRYQFRCEQVRFEGTRQQ